MWNRGLPPSPAVWNKTPPDASFFSGELRVLDRGEGQGCSIRLVPHEGTEEVAGP